MQERQPSLGDSFISVGVAAAFGAEIGIVAGVDVAAWMAVAFGGVAAVGMAVHDRRQRRQPGQISQRHPVQFNSRNRN